MCHPLRLWDAHGEVLAAHCLRGGSTTRLLRFLSEPPLLSNRLLLCTGAGAATQAMETRPCASAKVAHIGGGPAVVDCCAPLVATSPPCPTGVTRRLGCGSPGCIVCAALHSVWASPPAHWMSLVSA